MWNVETVAFVYTLMWYVMELVTVWMDLMRKTAVRNLEMPTGIVHEPTLIAICITSYIHTSLYSSICIQVCTYVDTICGGQICICYSPHMQACGRHAPCFLTLPLSVISVWNVCVSACNIKWSLAISNCCNFPFLKNHGISHWFYGWAYLSN